jgi:hypothetical protein
MVTTHMASAKRDDFTSATPFPATVAETGRQTPGLDVRFEEPENQPACSTDPHAPSS